MHNRALITGVTGQDGSYLAELLIAKGYEVHGLRRRSSTFGTGRIEHLIFGESPQLQLHYGDLSDGNGLVRLIREIRPTEVYNLAAQSHVRVSFDQPAYTADVTAVGTLDDAITVADQEYVDIYASTQKARLAKAARENGQADTTPEPAETDDSDSAEAV